MLLVQQNSNDKKQCMQLYVKYFIDSLILDYLLRESDAELVILNTFCYKHLIVCITIE